MRTVTRHPSSSLRTAAASFRSHARQQAQAFANAYDLARLRARLRDDKIAAKRSGKKAA
jgi:hypothetical protein